ncbi:hypothetical protein GQ600_11000 [Phytophthora cactorum]|nr:hypothetical protein GQ600_11000 [Phytophthora cactorum]
MREDGTWGGNQELYAAARLFQVYVVVHQDQPSARIMVIECDRLKPTRFVHVAYHGEDHYDSVRALRDPMDPDTLPVPIELDYDGFRAQDFAKRWQTHASASESTSGDQPEQRVVPNALTDTADGEVNRLANSLGEHLRSSSKSSSKRRFHKGVRSWFSFSSKTDNNGADLAADAATAAREVDDELQKTKQRTESGCSYVPRVEYGSPHCDVVERDAPWTSHEQVEQHYTALGLRVTNDDEGDTDKQNPPPPLPYRILHLLFKDDHYSSLHSNEDVKTIAPKEYTVAPTTNGYDPPRRRSIVLTRRAPDEEANKSYDPSRKNVKFQEVVEAMPPPREGKAFLYQEEDLPECGVLLPKQVLFKRGKRRVSGATLFSLVHVPSTSNLKPVVETTSVSTSSDASTATSSSEGQEDDSETKSPVSGRPKPKAPALRAVPVEFPSKTVFHKGCVHGQRSAQDATAHDFWYHYRSGVVHFLFMGMCRTPWESVLLFLRITATLFKRSCSL